MKCSDWDGGPRPNVPGRCPGVERRGCRLVLRTNKRCPVLKRPPTARGHCNRRPVASRAEGDPFYVIQHATTVDREAIVWDCARPRATAAILGQCSGQDLGRNSHAEDTTRLHGAGNPSERDEVKDSGGDVLIMSIAPPVPGHLHTLDLPSSGIDDEPLAPTAVS